MSGMGQKNILAYFKSMDEAQGVKKKLQSLRVIDVSVDRIGKYPGEGVQQNTNPITGDFPNLGHLTLDADFDNQSAGILAAADVSASGFSDGGQGGPTGRDVLLTAVVDEQTYDQAARIVQDGGGQI
jgi:hypothetical protein